MRSPLFILIASFIVSLLIAQQLGVGPGQRRADATDQLLGMVRREPRLALALAQADRGDPSLLMDWFNSARREERMLLAELQVKIASQAAGISEGTPPEQSDAALYRYRGRLGAMANIPIGDPDQDLFIDNLLAYIHVAGTARPTATDVAIARSLLPRLEAAMARAPDSAVWDTIGCVSFVAGDLPGARAAFDEAIRLGEQEEVKLSGARRASANAQLALYRTRRQFAIEAARLIAEQPDLMRPSLPLVAAPEFSSLAPQSAPIPAPGPIPAFSPVPAVEKP